MTGDELSDALRLARKGHIQAVADLKKAGTGLRIDLEIFQSWLDGTTPVPDAIAKIVTSWAMGPRPPSDHG